ncbi:hypothetical protein Glove_198g103 [Diversispora epigaea]|uniref:Uncharacterized protein n=1 Tax=Diversispora epigaea TaxID=1348612 RepID=A0A397ITW1_9GLOM|nr:hypothetical protein Glove_198g103 [Diversispora epigaea]
MIKEVAFFRETVFIETKEEDEILIRAVDLYGEKNWQQVVHCLDNRTRQQWLY